MPALTEEGLAHRADVLCRTLKKNPHQPLGILLRRQGIKDNRDNLLSTITEIHSDFRESLKGRTLDAALPVKTVMLDALCDFVLGCQRAERGGGSLAIKPSRAPVLLLECLGSLTDPRVTGDKVLSQDWQQVRAGLDKLVLERTRSPDGRSAFEMKLPAIRGDQRIETEQHPLSPLERIIGFDLFHDRETTSTVLQILRLAQRKV